MEKNQLLDEKFIMLLNTEVKSLRALKHPNIVNLLDFSDHGKIISSKDNTEKQVIYMVLELVPNGELFDYVQLTGKFSAPICRLYFKELCDVVGYLHSNNICHRDLKLENLMLDGQFRLKLLDFGFSTLVTGKDGSGLLSSYLGTELYMAPEISQGL